MRHLSYLAVLAGCLLGALWLEPVFRLGVLRRWRRLLLTIGFVLVAFGGWDVAGAVAGRWRYDRAQTVGLLLPGRLPVEEALFFVVVPLCAVLGFEAVRTVLARGSRRPDRPRSPDPAGPPSPDPAGPPSPDTSPDTFPDPAGGRAGGPDGGR